LNPSPSAGRSIDSLLGAFNAVIIYIFIIGPHFILYTFMFNITLATVATLQHCLEISALRVTRVATNDVLPYFYGCILIGFILQIKLIYSVIQFDLLGNSI